MTTTPHLPTIQFASDADAYQAGACNIGPDEIAFRRRAGYAGLAVAALLAGALVVIGAPHVARLLVALPLAGGAVGLLQARSKFCAAYGLRGVRNFGTIGAVSAVDDPVARAADRRNAFRIFGGGALIGLAGGVALALLPV